MRTLLCMVLLLLFSPAHAGSAESALVDRSELLPADLMLSSFLESPPEHDVAIGEARLFAVPVYGPQVYLLLLRLDFQADAPRLRSSRMAGALRLRPEESRLWAALLRLPEGRWPKDQAPEVLAPLRETLEAGCADTGQALVFSAFDGLFDDVGEDMAMDATLAGWRQQQEPVLMVMMRRRSDGSSGGSHLAQAWYLSSGRNQLSPLVCAPADAGYWSKPSYDMQGVPQDDGIDTSVVWTLVAGKAEAGDPVPVLELRERIDQEASPRVIARYRWNYDSYRLQAPPPVTSRTGRSVRSSRPRPR